jgi:hypothetical protein
MLPLNTDWAAAKSDPEGQFPKWNNVTQSRVECRIPWQAAVKP